MDFIDLKTQYRRIETPLNERMNDIMSNARFIMGKEVSELEEQLAQYTQRKHCISCSSGTDALFMSLMALGVKEGDAVFVPTFTFFSTAEVVSLAGATPIFIDVYEDTFNIDTEKLREAIAVVDGDPNLTAKAIIPVDLFGQPADMIEIQNIADENNLAIIEDAAQGFGGRINDKPACSFGDISATSFFPAKPLGCYGDGGAIFTDDDNLAQILKSIRVHGQGPDKYTNVRIGINGRLDAMQAAVLLEKLKIFDEETRRKNQVAAFYSEHLTDERDDTYRLTTPRVKDGYYSSWAQYTLLADSEGKRDEILTNLSEAGVPTAVYYKNPIHTLEMYKDSPYINNFDYSVSEDICKRVFSLPMHAYLTDSDLDKIVSCLNR